MTVSEKEDTLEWLEYRKTVCLQMAQQNPSHAGAYSKAAARYERHAKHVRALRNALLLISDLVYSETCAPLDEAVALAKQALGQDAKNKTTNGDIVGGVECVYLCLLDAGTNNACWVPCAEGDPGAVLFQQAE